MEYESIIARFEALADPKAADGMARYGIAGSKVYGVKIPVLRKLAKEAGKRNHELARKLWSHGSREARILAAMVDDHHLVTEEQLEQWVRDFDNWEVCDQCIMCLFDKTPFAWDKAFEWSAREEEFVKRAGFAMMARLAWSDRKTDSSRWRSDAAGDKKFELFLPVIKREANDRRNYVKKAVNWALRQIGKRSAYLNSRALETAREILALDTPTARWIASDAIREFESEAVRKKLGL